MGEVTERIATLERELAQLKVDVGTTTTTFAARTGDEPEGGPTDRRSVLRHVAVAAAVAAGAATVVGAHPAAAQDDGGPSRSDHSARARIDRLEAERAIVATLYAYGAALDYGGLDAFLACFTPDADYVVTFRINPAGGFSFHGHDELTTYFNGHTHAPAAWHKHVTTNEAITIRGRTATAMSYFLRVDAGATAGPAVVVASGRYLDELVADRSGRWRIRSRTAEVENL